jgi:hypothetical protein
MIKVYFQSLKGGHSELVATFRTDELYNQMLPSLEEEAAKQGCIVTESEIDVDYDKGTPYEGQAVGYSCLRWSTRDFESESEPNGSEEQMHNFFTKYNDTIIQEINELKSIGDY